MTKEDYRKYFEILELNVNASLLEIRNAYLHLKRLYSTDSIVTSPIMDEFPEDNREEILRQVEEAYTKLLSLFEEDEDEADYKEQLPAAFDDELKREIAEIDAFDGHILRKIREKLGIGLHDIALHTKIRLKYLENIESEQFDSLPPEVYLKGFVADYAKNLSLDPQKVVKDYMNKYNAWKKNRDKKS